MKGFTLVKNSMPKNIVTNNLPTLCFNLFLSLISGNNISLYSDNTLTTTVNSSTFTAYTSNGWVSSGNSVGGHFIYNNTVMNAPTKNDIICLNTQSGKLINYKSLIHYLLIYY